MATKKDYKWKFAIGTTSRVPGRTDLHYFIADFDGPESLRLCHETIDILLNGFSVAIQKTENGYHLYSNKKMRFSLLCKSLKHCGADISWIKIARNRGYFFLADKAAMDLAWPVERMTLRWSDPNGKR